MNDQTRVTLKMCPEQIAAITRLNTLLAEGDLLASDDDFQERLGKRDGGVSNESKVIAALSVEIFQLRCLLKYKFGWLHPLLKNSNWAI